MYSNTHLHAYLLYRSGLFHFLPFSSLLFSCLYLAGCLVDTEARDEMRVYSILHSVQYCLKIPLRFTVQFNGRHEVEAFLSDTRHEVGCRWTLAGQPVYITKWIYKGGMKMLHILYTVHHHMCVMTQQCACSRSRISLDSSHLFATPHPYLVFVFLVVKGEGGRGEEHLCTYTTYIGCI